MNKIRLLQTLVVLMVTVLTANCHSNQESSAAVNSNKLVVFTTASDVGLGTSRIPLNIRKTDGTPLMDIASEIEVSYSPEESNEDQIVKDLKWYNRFKVALSTNVICRSERETEHEQKADGQFHHKTIQE